MNDFIFVSSDSDYWGLITELPDEDFIVMAESSKCVPDIKNTLADRGFKYCYIDNSLKLNIIEVPEEAYRRTRANMSTAEKNQFYNKYIKKMKLRIHDDAEVTIDLGE